MSSSSSADDSMQSEHEHLAHQELDDLFDRQGVQLFGNCQNFMHTNSVDFVSNCNQAGNCTCPILGNGVLGLNQILKGEAVNFLHNDDDRFPGGDVIIDVSCLIHHATQFRSTP